MKILYAWRRIDNVSGGVERMITAMMNEMVRRGHDVSLLTWDHDQARPYYAMNEKIVWHRLNMGDPMKTAGLILRLKRMAKIRNIIKSDKPDVVIGFESGVFFSVYVPALGLGIPLIAAERNAPSRLEFIPLRKKKAIFRILSRADKVIVQFERYRDSYPESFRKRIVALHNPVKPATVFAAPGGTGSAGKTLLAVTRLAYQKNLDVLIESFAKLSATHPDWKLVIAGDGEDQARIEQMIVQSHMQDRIILLGAVRDVESLYRDAHLFCLPSRWEGFPNALAEALAHGLPAVGFAECSGVSDLIQEGTNGLLAEGNGNVDSLTAALSRLMGSDDLRLRMGRNAVESMAPYKPEAIFDCWERLFSATAEKS